VIIGLGCGLIFGPAQNAATSGVKFHEAGAASAMVNTAQQIGGSIGTAVFSSLAATQSRTISMPDVETTRAKQQPATVS
jgi:predicted signal transduction protein with EAL and GGDEF domain